MFIQVQNKGFIGWQLRIALAIIVSFFGPKIFFINEVIFIFLFPFILSMMTEKWKNEGLATKESVDSQFTFLANVGGIVKEKEKTLENIWFNSEAALNKKLKTIVLLKIALHTVILLLLTKELFQTPELIFNFLTLIFIGYFIWSTSRTISLFRIVFKNHYQVIKSQHNNNDYFSFLYPDKNRNFNFLNLALIELE